MGSECVYSFWDLYKAANKQQATKKEKEKFFNLSQKQRNEQVKQWAEKAGWGIEDRIGSDGQIYTAFSPLWEKKGVHKRQPRHISNNKMYNRGMSLTRKKCIPCEAGMPPLTAEEIQKYIKDVDNSWEVAENKKIKRMFKLKNFKQAISFINKIAEVAESEGHHPNLHIYYNKVKVVLTTHAIGGLSENDFIMAAKIDKITDL